MKNNTAKESSLAKKAAPVSASYTNSAYKDEIRHVVAGGTAWNTELVHYKTTHGPMDVRLWRESK